MTEIKKLQELNKFLVQCTGKNRYNVLFDSNEEELNISNLINKIRDKTGLMVVCKYGEIIFGCYNSNMLSEKDQTLYIDKDKKHFVFIFNTTTNKGEKYQKIDYQNQSLIINNTSKSAKSDSNQTHFLECYGAFILESDSNSKRSQIDYSFPGNYDVKKGVSADIFIGQKFFMYDSLTILEWL
ncbi:hypothetical protein CL6EHI_121480 [Entamoeba histolytica]|uniref:TLDc domain-containing protein n=3 Tax=Entamoeba histolytica TaxID=5759 RepID=C4M925_ENTH1|nr:hypothetical protein EHI_121480 [Entamoeba histolytica HM-1:IMSS]EAL43059.1 hypothetical protein EHI_121480 [Entamoeba histolytica HM-1:IMSS]EMD45555.1 Hypothetical protein EHI5A_270730 [Entamoeba histolytica KU27]GAT98139.1 hypothetical protein CL6EHI_121480 [Entamoeba histolytica]|eukprot:XP_648447.1 hypothetical protein EHI_121480 [Entamoeba histolytica HM-1:IMSS]